MKFSFIKKYLGIFYWLSRLGNKVLGLVRETGCLTILFLQAVFTLLTTPLRGRSTIRQMDKIGVESLSLTIMTALFTGMVLALQSAYQLKKFQALRFTADLVAMSMTRELGPVLTAMVVAGRVGASITAEIGTMKVTEQIDALESLATDPIRYLVVPRLVAAFFMLGILTVYADFVGMFGGYLIAVFKLGVSSDQYIWRAVTVLKMKDVMTGLVKSLWFGAIISTVGCYFGFRTEGGAEGVGRATTLSVVTSLILIIAFDCLFTAIFYFVV